MYWDHILHYLLYSPSFPFELLSKYSTSDCTIEDAIPPSPPPRHPPPSPVMGCRRADVHCCCVLKIEMTGTYLDDSVSWNSSPSLAFNILSCQSQSAPTPHGCVCVCLSVCDIAVPFIVPIVSDGVILLKSEFCLQNLWLCLLCFSVLCIISELLIILSFIRVISNI